MKVLYIITACLLVACGSDDPGPVEAPLDRAKFEEVLAASLLIEARLNHEMVVDQRTDSPIKQYYAEMFKEHGVTEADFKTSFDRYAERPEELKKVYEDVLNDLQQRADSTAH